MGVVVVNTVWIAIETDYNHANVLCQAAPIFQIMDNAFCFIFTFEILVRFLSFSNKKDALQDGWFVFDASLVVLMVWETWVMTVLYEFAGFAGGGDIAKDS